MQVWPFPPSAELIEAVSWWTEVLPTVTSEQRLCRRQSPRREYFFTGNVRDYEAATARHLMRDSMQGWLIPDWPRAVRMYAMTGAPVALPDGPVVVWRGVYDIDQTTVAGGSLGTVATAGDARVIPLLVGRQVGPWELTNAAGGWCSQSVTFEVANTIDEGAPGYYGQYLGHDFVSHGGCMFGQGTAQESHEWERDVFDNNVAAPIDFRIRDWPSRGFSARWWARDGAALREWIYTLRGRWKSFWLPSRSDDMGFLSGGGDALQVRHYHPSEQHLAINVDGVLYPRAVVSYSVGSTATVVNLDGALPAGAVTGAHYLRKVRLDSDRIEFSHKAAAGVSVAAPVIEVPE